MATGPTGTTIERVASTIAAQWVDVPSRMTLEVERRIYHKVRDALADRGLRPEPEERLYAEENALVRHSLMDSQYFTESKILGGAWSLDVRQSRMFVDAFLPEIVPDVPDGRCRLGVDGAGIRAGMQTTKGSPSEKVFGFTYVSISNPEQQNLRSALVIGALEPPETTARLSVFIAIVRALMKALGIKGFLHGDHGFYKKLLKTTGCPWCAISFLTKHLKVFNSPHEVVLDDDLPMVPGILHYLCVVVSAILMSNDTPTVRDSVAKWSTFDFDSVDYDSVSIKELTTLAGKENLISELSALLPTPVTDALVAVLDMRSFSKSRSLADWETMMERISTALPLHSIGVHIGWHVPSIARQLFGGSLQPMVEQIVEHVNQEFIFLRRRHNLYATARLIQWRNAVHFPLTASHVLAILRSRSPGGNLLQIREGSVAEVTHILRERTETAERLMEAPLISYLSGRHGPDPDGHLHLLLAVMGQHVIGYNAAVVSERSVYMFDFFVREGFRQVGVGSELLRRRIAAASSPLRINKPTARTRSMLITMGLTVVDIEQGDVMIQ